MQGKTPRDAMEDWAGILDQREARRIRQELCQLRHRPDFAKPFEDDSIPSVREMTCAILRRLCELSDCPRAGMAHHFGHQDQTRMKSILETRHWPSEKLKSPQIFKAIAQWVIMGGARGKLLGATDPNSLKIRNDVVREIVGYFFPQGYSETNAPYFRSERRLSDAPWEVRELRLVLEWIRRQIKLENPLIAGIPSRDFPTSLEVVPASASEYLGQVIIIAPSSETIDVFNATDIRAELARVSVESKFLELIFLHPSDSTGFVADVQREGAKHAAKDEKRTGKGIRPIPIHQSMIEAEEMIHPLFGYFYLAFGLKEDVRARLHFVRPFGGGRSKTPLCVAATDRERAKFVEWFEREYAPKHLISVLHDGQHIPHEDGE